MIDCLILVNVFLWIKMKSKVPAKLFNYENPNISGLRPYALNSSLHLHNSTSLHQQNLADHSRSPSAESWILGLGE